ncbi:MAG: hypothetical protein CMK07_16055 [Ponticaulis sp.]|nr:hypothetical protein [Ponticaulis sp.]
MDLSSKFFRSGKSRPAHQYSEQFESAHVRDLSSETQNTRSGPIRQLISIVYLLLAFIPVSHAQSIPSSGSSSGTEDPPGVVSDIMGAIDDASRLMVKGIQPGSDRNLVTDPYFNSQESPRHSLMSFIEAMDLVQRGFVEAGYERALRNLPAGATEDDADTMHQILLRVGPLAATDAPGPDRIESTGDTRFLVFPRPTSHNWIWSRVQPPPDAQIALELDESSIWRFSDDTLRNAGDLLDAVSELPPSFDTNAKSGYYAQVFSPLFEETGLIGWLGFVGVSLTGFALAYACTRGMKWLAKRDMHRALRTALSGAGHATALLIVTLALTIAFGFLSLGPVLEPLQYEIPRFFMIVAMTLVVLSMIEVAATVAEVRAGNDAYDRMLITTLQRVARVTVIGLVIMFILQVIFAVNVGTVFIGFGVVALALSLAAQDTVKNVFGAVSIFMNRPFVVGDWIIFKGENYELCGVVDDIELQATKVTDLSGTQITLPNMQFINREVQNLSARRYIRRNFDVAIPYHSNADDVQDALDALREVLTNDEVAEDAMINENDGGDPHITFYEFDESWLTLKSYHYYYFGGPGETQRDTDRDWFTYLDHCSLVNRKVVEVFHKRNIEFAFPTQTIELHGEKALLQGEPAAG